MRWNNFLYLWNFFLSHFSRVLLLQSSSACLVVSVAWKMKFTKKRWSRKNLKEEKRVSPKKAKASKAAASVVGFERKQTLRKKKWWAILNFFSPSIVAWKHQQQLFWWRIKAAQVAKSPSSFSSSIIIIKTWNAHSLFFVSCKLFARFFCSKKKFNEKRILIFFGTKKFTFFFFPLSIHLQLFFSLFFCFKNWQKVWACLWPFWFSLN